MSTKIQTKLINHTVVTYGDSRRGVCVQVTAAGVNPALGGVGYINLSMREASELATVLLAFVNEEASRRIKGSGRFPVEGVLCAVGSSDARDALIDLIEKCT